MPAMAELTLDTIVNLCKRRGIVMPSSEIYGGLRSAWDWGPLGIELKRNVKNEWWKAIVHGRGDVVGLESSILMSPKVWEASGHVETFTDPLVECTNCHKRFRADHIDLEKNCPSCGRAPAWTEPRQFNLMFKTHMGPVEDSAHVIYLRPETAQGMFVDFQHIQVTMRKRIPFGIAQQGKSFRNEITPGNFVFRTREFEQMEMEFFVKPGTDDEWHDYWLEAAHELVQGPRHDRGETATPRARVRRTLALREAHLRHRVRLPRHGLVRARGHREPHRLRSQGALASTRDKISRTSSQRPRSATCPTLSSRLWESSVALWRS